MTNGVKVNGPWRARTAQRTGKTSRASHGFGSGFQEQARGLHNAATLQMVITNRHCWRGKGFRDDMARAQWYPSQHIQHGFSGNGCRLGWLFSCRDASHRWRSREMLAFNLKRHRLNCAVQGT